MPQMTCFESVGFLFKFEKDFEFMLNDRIAKVTFVDPDFNYFMYEQDGTEHKVVTTRYKDWMYMDWKVERLIKPTEKQIEELNKKAKDLGIDDGKFVMPKDNRHMFAPYFLHNSVKQ